MKLVFGVAVIIVAIYLGVEFVPPYYANYEFEDSLKNEALFGTNNATTRRHDSRQRLQKSPLPGHSNHQRGHCRT